MIIRISEPLVTILLKDGIDLAAPEKTMNEAVEAAGGRIQAMLIETVASSAELLCPACFRQNEAGRLNESVVVSVCPACGSPFVAFQRGFPGLGERWYSFNPF